MRNSILHLALIAVVFSSCSTSYKTGQTPDDVYFSPARPQDEYVRVKDREDNSRYQEEDVYADEDRYLRMKVRNRSRWSYMDDRYSYNSRYSYSYYNCWCSNPWSPYTYWNYYYNPYGSPGIIFNSKTAQVNTSPRMVNLNTYNNNQITTKSYTSPKSMNDGNTRTPVRVFGSSSNNSGNSGNSGSNTGNVLRSIFGGSNNNSSSGSSSSGSSSGSTSKPSSSGSSSGSSGSSAPVRKF